MKRVAIVSVIILAVIIVGIFLINIREQDTEVTQQRTKIGFLMNGSRDDHSWGESHYEGMLKSAEDLNLEVFFRENVPQTQECVEVMEELIACGCEIIICNSFDFGEWVQQVAPKYPEIYFFHATGIVFGDNLATCFGRMYQMRYLCGIVAGLQTETNEIGYVAAYPISEVNRGINAFTLGVRSVNPDAVVYVEWSNTWTGETETEAATRKLLENHNIDILAMHSDSNIPLEIAQEAGIWSIGYNLDNSSLYPDSYLTAAVWHWENFYGPRILECLQGKFVGESYWEGVETGLVSLAPLTANVKEGIAQAVEQEKERLESGTFDVFYGPIRDQEGNIRVGVGESMPDSLMLNEFDWYVEGVMINGEE